jgi:hypothetical protein
MSANSWREIARLLAERVARHGECPWHLSSEAADGCQFCENRAALHVWQVAEELASAPLVDKATVEVYPPSCVSKGCVHHYNTRLDTCICPAYWDMFGYHTVDVNPRCPAHRVPVEVRDL